VENTRAWLVVAVAFVSNAVAALIRALAAEWRLREAIRELELLNDHRLRDLGLTRLNIERAVRRGRDSAAEVPPATRRPGSLTLTRSRSGLFRRGYL
jgi:uncharacterized protein YjiS (DUF1127 family)